MHRRTLRRWVVTLFAPLALTLSLGVPKPAHAADAATRLAKSHFQRGTGFYRQARYQDAIDEFRAAYAAKANADILFNIGQCQEKLGDAEGALESYRQYLAAVPDAKDRAEVETVMSNLEERVKAAKSRPQKVSVTTEPSGAQVTVDGNAQGTTPANFELVPGAHELLVNKQGFTAVRREVTVSSEPLSVDLVLSPEAQLHPWVSTETPKPEKPPRKKVWTWVAFGAAGGALVAGGAVGFLANQSAKTLTSNRQPDRATADSLEQQAKTRATTANVLYGVGGGLAAVGLTLLFVEGRF